MRWRCLHSDQGIDRKAEVNDSENEFVPVSGNFGLTTQKTQGVVLCNNIYGDYYDPLDKKYYTGRPTVSTAWTKEEVTGIANARGRVVTDSAWTWDTSAGVTARTIDIRITPDCYEKIVRLEQRGSSWPTTPSVHPGRIYVFFSINVNETDVYGDPYGTIANQNAMRVDVIAWILNRYYFPINNVNWATTAGFNKPGHRQELRGYKPSALVVKVAPSEQTSCHPRTLESDLLPLAASQYRFSPSKVRPCTVARRVERC